MSWSETLQQILLGIAPMLIAFILTYYVKDRNKREEILNRIMIITTVADKAVAAAEDFYANSATKPSGIEKLRKAVDIAKQLLAKVNIQLSDEEIEAEVRTAYQNSPYAKHKEETQ
jgi:type II secretory pathway component PulF